MSLGNVAFHWLTSGLTLLAALACCGEQRSFGSENVKKCIRKRITVLKIVIGGKSSVLWSLMRFTAYCCISIKQNF